MFKIFCTINIINALFIISCITCLALSFLSYSETSPLCTEITGCASTLLALVGIRLTLECILMQCAQAKTLKEIIAIKNNAKEESPKTTDLSQ